MPSYSSAIDDLRERIAKNDELIADQLRQLGEAISSAGGEALSGSSFNDTVNEIAALHDSIIEKQKTIRKWKEIEQQLSELRDEMREVDADIAECGKRLEPHYEDIGTAALRAFQDNRLGHKRFEDVLSVLSELDDEIRDRERELQQVEDDANKESFLGKTLARGKGMVLKGGLKARELQMSRQLREAGERICAMEISDIDESSPLGRALLPVRSSSEEMGKHAARKESLAKRRASVEEQRISIEKQEHMRNPLHNLQHEIERLESQTETLHQGLGKLYLEAKTKGKIKSEATETCVDAIGKLQKENVKLEKLILRFRAAIEVERLDNEIKEKQRRQDELAKEAQRVAGDIDTLKEAREKQATARGSMKTLKVDEETPDDNDAGVDSTDGQE